jgi:hypothetical protein
VGLRRVSAEKPIFVSFCGPKESQGCGVVVAQNGVVVAQSCLRSSPENESGNQDCVSKTNLGLGGVPFGVKKESVQKNRIFVSFCGRG